MTAILSVFGVVLSLVSVTISLLAFRHAKGLDRRELRLEAQKASGDREEVTVTVHNLGQRAETVSLVRIVDGGRQYEEPAGNVVVPGHAHNRVFLGRNMVCFRWNENYPKLTPCAYIEVETVAGTTRKTERLDPWLLVDDLTAGVIEATGSA